MKGLLRNNVKAFTISELLVVLIITSILSISLYYAYLALSKQLILFDRQQEELSEMYRFYSRMSHEFNTSDRAVLAGGILVLYFTDREISYSIESNIIKRRQSNKLDELSLRVLSKQFLFEGEIVRGSSKLIDRMTLKIESKNQRYNWSLSKTYDAFTQVQYSRRL